MVTVPIDDGEPVRLAPICDHLDRNGEAALLLVESLIHALIAKAALTIGEAIEVVDSAAEVLVAQCDAQGLSPAATARSEHLLLRIADSLRTAG